MKKLLILMVLLACTPGKETERDRFFLLGNQALSDREYPQAIDLYTKSIQADPDFSSAYNNRGVAKVEDDRPHEAILDYNMAIELDTTNHDAMFNRAYALESVGRFDDAFEDITTLESVYGDSSYIFFYKGLLQTKLRKYEEGKQSFFRAIQLDSSNTESFVNLATLYYFQDQLDSAEYWLKYTLKKDPNEANAYNTLSQVFVARGEFSLALGALGEALKLVPQEPYFLNNRGYVYLNMDSLELALRDINKGIVMDPTNAWAYRNKGIYYLKQKEYTEAIRLFEEALSRNTFMDEIYSFMGEAYFELGERPNACDTWKLGAQNEEIRSKKLLNLHCR